MESSRHKATNFVTTLVSITSNCWKKLLLHRKHSWWSILPWWKIRGHKVINKRICYRIKSKNLFSNNQTCRNNNSNFSSSKLLLTAWIRMFIRSQMKCRMCRIMHLLLTKTSIIISNKSNQMICRSKETIKTIRIWLIITLTEEIWMLDKIKARLFFKTPNISSINTKFCSFSWTRINYSKMPFFSNLKMLYWIQITR